MDISYFLAREIFKPIFKKTIGDIKSLTSEHGVDLAFRKGDLQEALFDHLNTVLKQCSDINFNDLRTSKDTISSYIELDSYVIPLRNSHGAKERQERVPIKKIAAEETKNMIIYGLAGAGKTTSVKFLCIKMLSGELDTLANFPIFIKLRDLSPRFRRVEGGIYDELFNIFLLNFTILADSIGHDDHGFKTKIKETIVNRLLNNMKPIIILDGFDELSSPKQREKIAHELDLLGRNLYEARFILTCRSGEFNYSVTNSQRYEICPLNNEQVRGFAEKWLGNPGMANDFYKKLEGTPYFDTTIRPLNLAYLCAIYERRLEIPEQPRSVYSKIVKLLIEEWDEQRGITRQSLAGLQHDIRIDFISHFAFIVSTQLKKLTFSRSEMTSCYKYICTDYGLEYVHVERILDEMEAHTGLFVQVGYDDFEFCHKSIQEYLTANYIVRLPKLIEKVTTVQYLPNELAVCIAISSNPTSYFTLLCQVLIKESGSLSADFYTAFFMRLSEEKVSYTRNENAWIAGLELASIFIAKAERTYRTFKYIISSILSMLDSLQTKNPHLAVDLIYATKEPQNIGGISITKYRNPEIKSQTGVSHVPEYLYLPTAFSRKRDKPC